MIAAIRAIIAAAAISHGASVAVLDEMARCESTYNPLAVSEPNLGLYQLSRYGKLREFYQQGYTDWTDAYQQADFTAAQVVVGAGPAWACYPRWLLLTQ